MWFRILSPIIQTITLELFRDWLRNRPARSRSKDRPIPEPTQWEEMKETKPNWWTSRNRLQRCFEAAVFFWFVILLFYVYAIFA